ncbi:MAG: DUF2145 domain-containing protein [Burkholderiales bacterium]|nr:DUF2145 domain-containing protein [Burkholderiales bacterium]
MPTRGRPSSWCWPTIGTASSIRAPSRFDVTVLRALALAAGLWTCAGAGHAASASPQFCDRASPLTAQQQDRLLRFAAIVRHQLDDAGAPAALIARSGLDLRRFGIRYSHAGVSVRAGSGDVDGAAWAVRQLYYACDERRPRLYDQGLAGFVFGTDDPAVGYVSLLLLPPGEGRALQQAALDTPRALRLLAVRYSANAYPFSLHYQNCNQLVIELLAAAWGGLADGDDLRARAQAWLSEQGYAPTPVDVGSHWLMFAAGFIPWVHLDDHPDEDRFALRLRISLPSTIATFVHERLPNAKRIELCHDERQVVIRRDGPPLAEGCRAEAGDRVIAFD